MYGWNFLVLVVGGALLLAFVSYLVTCHRMRRVRPSALALSITCAACEQRNTAGATICRVCDSPLVAPTTEVAPVPAPIAVEPAETPGVVEEDVAGSDDRMATPEHVELVQDLSPRPRDSIRR